MDDVPTSPRLTFRRMDEADLDDLARLLGDPAVMVHYPRPKTREEAADWIAWNVENYARDGFGLWLLYDGNGTFVGECGLTWQRVEGVPYLEVGHHLLPKHQGKGLARRRPRPAATMRGPAGSSGWWRSSCPTTSPPSAWRSGSA